MNSIDASLLRLLHARRAFEAEDIARALITAGLVAVEQARKEEREACAQMVESYGKPPAWIDAAAANSIANCIRARGT